MWLMGFQKALFKYLLKLFFCITPSIARSSITARKTIQQLNGFHSLLKASNIDPPIITAANSQQASNSFSSPGRVHLIPVLSIYQHRPTIQALLPCSPHKRLPRSHEAGPRTMWMRGSWMS